MHAPQVGGVGLGQAGDAQGILATGALGSLGPSDTAAVTAPSLTLSLPKDLQAFSCLLF